MRLWGVKIFHVAALFFFLFAACVQQPVTRTPGFVPPSETKQIRGVPFYPDDSKQCGPAALAAVLNYRGGNYDLARISQAVFRANLGGTVTLEMIYFARKEGFRAKWFNGGLSDLVEAVDSGDPLIVMVDYGFLQISKYHFMVVVGYCKQGVIVFSGREKDKLIYWDDFRGPWSRTKHWTLMIGDRT